MKMVMFGSVMLGKTGIFGEVMLTQHWLLVFFTQQSSLLLLLQQSCSGQQLLQHEP